MIYVNAITHDKQRYPTAGDWQIDENGLHITVSKIVHQGQRIPDMEYLLAVHEIIEAILCQAHGVTDREVTRWDIEHLKYDDSGAVIGSPYYREHMFASLIERALAAELNVDWDLYEDLLLTL